MKKVAELKLNADTETLNRSEMTHEELENAQVGHAWVSLTYDNARAAPASLGQPTKGLVRAGGTAMGFWPLVFRAEAWSRGEQARLDAGHTPGDGASLDRAHTGFSFNPFTNVPGRVEEPDTRHEAKASKVYSLTQPQVDALMTYVKSKRSASYNLYNFNCTTFAVEAVKAAGQSPPSGAGWLSVCFPNALYRDLYQLQKKGDATVTTTPLDAGERHE